MVDHTLEEFLRPFVDVSSLNTRFPCLVSQGRVTHSSPKLVSLLGGRLKVFRRVTLMQHLVHADETRDEGWYREEVATQTWINSLATEAKP